MFKQVDPKQNFPQKEEEILKFWQKNKIFEKSLAQNKNNKLFRFYDGPPFATGLPHYGHILAMAIKDTIVRYKTMQGYYVPRRFGWDCHGLPVENLIEKELGISGKPEIEKLGVEKFNNACCASVLRYTGEWRKTIERIARWGDLDNVYITMDNNYIESIWWVFKQIYDKGLIYKGFKSMPYCPRCGTPLSNFETNLGYQENTPDPSIYIKFKILSAENRKPKTASYFLAWTTTPWTLPGNAALAINKNLKYQAIQITNGDVLILAESRIKDAVKEPYKVVKSYQGKDLLGWQYEPLYKISNFQPASPAGGFPISNLKTAYKVYSADFVSTEDGTGIVHIAPAFGEDDLNLGLKEKLPIIQTVDKNGKMFTEDERWDGDFVKKADKKITSDLEHRGLAYRVETIKHTYPFCWRCDTPLIYYAIDTWFIKVSKIRAELVKNNKEIHWVPEHIKDGRFGKWLADARDWAVTRNRYWGAPVPIWICDKCKETRVIDNIKELEKLSGQKIKNLHRPYIDQITIKCDKCGGQMQRIEEVLDCWFESGSMPYAQFHYPHEMNEREFDKRFPADFIAEGLDQTRGWFYTLHVISTILFKKPAFYNCIVNGIVLAADGKKLSKRLRNYPEPAEIFDTQGVDALRWFLLSSPAAVAEDVRFSSQHVADTVRRVILILWNVYSFFTTYANIDKWMGPKKSLPIKSRPILDQWVISYLNQTTEISTKWLDKYNLPKAMRPIEEFITNLSTWYLRRSRKRRDGAFYHTMQEILLNLVTLMAPFAPFITEEIYQNLKFRDNLESIHLVQWPQITDSMIDQKLLEQMQMIREIVEKVHALRAECGIKVRQPLAKLKIQSSLQLRSGQAKIKIKELLDIIAEEINVKEVIIDSQIKSDLELDTKITPELRKEGIVRDIIRQIQRLRKSAKLTPNDKITICYRSPDKLVVSAIEQFQKEILSATVSTNICNNINQQLISFIKIKSPEIELGIGLLPK